MNVRRAVELNFIQRLQSALVGTDYPVVESKELTEERPKPVVICIAGDATNPFSDLTQSVGNYNVPFTVMVLTSKDSDRADAAEMHTEVVTRLEAAMASRDARKVSIQPYLHLYDAVKGEVSDGDEGRNLGTALTYTVVCNYLPRPI